MQYAMLYCFADTLCACWLSGIIDGFDFAVKSCLLAGPHKSSSSLLCILKDSINDENVHKDT